MTNLETALYIVGLVLALVDEAQHDFRLLTGWAVVAIAIGLLIARFA